MVENDMTKVDTGIMDKSKSKGEKPNCGFLVPKTRGFSVPKTGGSSVPKTVIKQSLSLKSAWLNFSHNLFSKENVIFNFKRCAWKEFISKINCFLKQ